MSEQTQIELEDTEINIDAEPTEPTEDVEDFEVEEEATDNQEAEKSTQDNSSDDEYVPVDDPAIQKRINNLYKQVKMSDSRNQMKDEMLEKAMQRIEELESRFAKTDEAQAETLLMERLREARDEGDDDSYDKIQQELIDFRANKIIEQKLAKQQKQPIVNYDAEAKYVTEMAMETLPNGDLARPWLHPDHPKYNDVIGRAAQLAVEYDGNDPYMVNKIMTQIDKEMAGNAMTQKKNTNNRAPDPMQGTNLTNNSTRSKIKLSKEEVAMAKKLGMSPEKYAQGKKMTGLV